MHTHCPQETRQLGEKLAHMLVSGDVILLRGDLGAGKSELVRGIAKGLGISGPIPSPSFTILNYYDEGRIPLAHFDWYRLNSSEELYEMGMDEYLGGDCVAIVEWPSQCPDAIPSDYLEITIHPAGECDREISWKSFGNFRKIQLEGINNEGACN